MNFKKTTMYNYIDEVTQEVQDRADEYFNGDPCNKMTKEEKEITCLYFCYKRIFCNRKDKIQKI